MCEAVVTLTMRRKSFVRASATGDQEKGCRVNRTCARRNDDHRPSMIVALCMIADGMIIDPRTHDDPRMIGVRKTDLIDARIIVVLMIDVMTIDAGMILDQPIHDDRKIDRTVGRAMPPSEIGNDPKR